MSSQKSISLLGSESNFYLKNSLGYRFYLDKRNEFQISTVAKACLWLAGIPIAGVIGVHSVQAQSIVPAPDGTNTIVTPQDNRFDINGGQTSGDGANLFHSFTEFGLSEGQIANFLSRPDILNILARINGGNVSFINGLIQVTGGNSNLFLMNPSGIIFGPNASLNVPGAFTATTANGIGFGANWFNAIGTNNYANLVGKPNAFAFTMNQPGNILNFGNLAVGIGQDLSLLAGTIINEGQLSAPSGNVTIAAVPGESLVRLSQPGYLLSLEISSIDNNNNIINNWNLPIASLPQMLTGGNGGSATGVRVNQNGSVELTGSGISVEQGTAIVSGRIDVSGKSGGNINILGEKVGVVSANINASGTHGGGNVRIGGDEKGKGTLPNALLSLISKDSTIIADSFTAGNGGSVVIWADKNTGFYGSISAKGGSEFGDGGFVEISGKENLIFAGKVDTNAPKGSLGTLLLDPKNITIVNGNGGTKDGELTDNQILQGEGEGTEFTISETKLEGLAKDANIILEATDNITINNLADNTLDLKASTGSIAFTADANKDGVGNFAMNGANDIIQTQGGAVNIYGANIAVGGIVTIGGEIKLTTPGEIKGAGDGGTINFDSSNTAAESKGGKITLNAGKDIDIFNVSSSGRLLSGDILITSSNGNISTADVDADSEVGDGGKISIEALNGSISTADVNTTSVNNGSGGDIIIVAKNDITTNRVLARSLESSDTSHGGAITVTSSNGKITASDIDSSISSGVKGGAITLNAKGDIVIDNGDGGGDIDSSASGKATGGNITVSSKEGSIIVVDNVNSSSGNGTAGNVNFSASPGGKIILDRIDSTGKIGGNIVLTGDEINYNSTLAGGAVVLEPSTVSLPISLGNSIDGDDSLDITTTELDNLVDGFKSITIGRANGTGNVTIISDITFSDPVLIQGGSITSNGSIITNGNNLSLISNTGNIDTTKGELNTAGDEINGGDISVTAKNGNITIGNINSSSLSLDAGKVTFSATNGTINVNGNINASGGNRGNDINFDTPVTLATDATFTTGKNTGDINFNSTVDGTKQLNITAGTQGIVRFKALAGGKAPLGKLDITTAQNIEVAGGITTANKDISLNSPVKLTGDAEFNAGTANLTFGSSLSGDSFNITFTSDKMSFVEGDVSGKGTIKIQPFTAGLNIRLGAEPLPDSTALDLGSSLNKLQDGFSSITIGRSNNSGQVSLVSPITFKDPVTIQSPAGGGSIAFSGGSITGTGNASINLIADRDIAVGDIKSTAGISIKSNSGNIDSSAGTLDSSNTSGKGGDITLKATKDIITGAVNSSGSAGGGKIDVTSSNGEITGGFNSNSSSGDGGSIAIQSPVKITATGINSTGKIDTGNIILTSKEINFNGAANSVKGKGNVQLQPFTENQNLNITTKDVAALADGFTSIIIGRDNGSGSITISNPFTFSDPTIIQSPSGSIIVNGAIKGTDNASITIIGNTTLNNDITTVDRDITIKGNTTLEKNVTISTGANSGGDIQFNGTINGNPDLTLETGTGNIAVDNAIGNNTRIGNLTINSANNVTTKDIAAASITQKIGNGNTSFGSLNTNTLPGITLNGNNFSLDGTITTSSSGTVTINNNGLLSIADVADMNLDGAFNQTGKGAVVTAADITTTNDNISFSNPVNLAGNITLNPGNADINFDRTVDGSFDLKLIAGIGDITFTGNVGNQTRIGNLTIQNANNLKADKITAASITQKAGTGTTTLGNLDTNTPAGINLKGNSFNLNGNVNTTNSGGFTINNNSPLNFSANTKFTLDGDFNQTGKGAVSTAANITTTNDDINFSSPVTLTGNITLNTGNAAGDIKFGNPVDGGFDLNLIAGSGDISFVGNVGNQIRIGNLIVENANNFQADKITAASITQKAGTGTTSLGNLNTNTAAGIDLKGNIFNLNGAVTTTKSGSFTIDNQSLLDIAANADFNLDGEFKQIGKGAVSTASDITTSNDNITFSSPVTLKGNVALNTDKGAGDIKFGNTVDGSFDLNLNVGTGNINVIGAVGSQTRIGNLTIDNANDVKAGAVTAASITQKAGTGTTTLGAVNTNTPQGISLSGNNLSLNGSIATTKSGTFTINNSGILNIADVADMKLDGTFNQTGKGAIFTAGDIITNNKDIGFTGSVTLTGNVTFNPGIGTIAFNSSLAAGNNPLTLTAGEIDFGRPVSGSNTLILQPATVDRNVSIGTFNPTAWNLTSTEIALLQNGFSSITIGRSDSTAQTNVNNVTFSDAVTIRGGAGTIEQNGPIAGIDNASITLDSAIATLNADISATGGNITVGRNVILGKDVTISTSKGDINFTGPIEGDRQLTLNATNGNIIFNAAVGARTPLNNLNIISARNAIVAGGINTSNSLQFNMPVLLTADSIFSTGAGKDITFNALVTATKANNFILNPNSGNVTFNNAVIGVGNISIVNANNFTAASTIEAASLLYTAGKGDINLLGNVTANGDGGVDIRTDGNIRTNNIISNGNNITLSSNKNPITTATLDTSSTTKTGGNIFVSSPTAAVTTNDLRTRGVEAGGNVTVISGDRINTGNIDVSASIGKGGSVFLDPPNDIQVGSINAQGGTSGTGGNVDITTAHYFRAIGEFSDRNNINSSISTAGGTGGGSIIIRHGGGDLNTPFVVGNTTTPNGTFGALTSGEFTISPIQSFPGSYTLGNISIITSTPTPPVVPPVIPPIVETLPPVIVIPPVETPVIPPIVENLPPVIVIPPIVENLPPVIPPIVETLPPVIPPIVENLPPVIPPVVENLPPIQTETIPPNNLLTPPVSVVSSIQVNPLLQLANIRNLPRNNPLNLVVEPLPQLPSLTPLTILRGALPESTYLIASPFDFGNACANPSFAGVKQAAKCLTISPALSSNDVLLVSVEDNVPRVLQSINSSSNFAEAGFFSNPDDRGSVNSNSNFAEAGFFSISNFGEAGFSSNPNVAYSTNSSSNFAEAGFSSNPTVIFSLNGNSNIPEAGFSSNPTVIFSLNGNSNIPEGNFTTTTTTIFSTFKDPIVPEPSIPIGSNLPEGNGSINISEPSTAIGSNIPEGNTSVNNPTNAGVNNSEVAIQPFTPADTNNTNTPNNSSTSSNSNTSISPANTGINPTSPTATSNSQNNQNTSNSNQTNQTRQSGTSNGQNNQNASSSNPTNQPRQNNQSSSPSATTTQTNYTTISRGQNTSNNPTSTSTSRGQNTSNNPTSTTVDRAQTATSSSQNQNPTISNTSRGNQTASSGTSAVSSNSNVSASNSTSQSSQPASSGTQTDRSNTASTQPTARENRISPSFGQSDPNTLKIAQRAQECEQQVDYIRRTRAGQRNQSNYEKLIECYLQNLAIAREFKNQQWEQYALNNLAVTYFVVGDYAKSIEYHKQHLELARQMENRMGEALALGGIGAAYAAIGDYKKAIKFYNQSLAITESIPAPQWEGPTVRNLGNAYLAQKNYEKAIEYQEKSLAISRQNKDRYGEAQALGNLGNAYSALGEFQKAIEYQEQSLTIAKEIGDRLQQAQGLLNLGTTYSSTGDYAKALEYHQQSLAIVQELRARLGEGIALTNLGDALFHLRQLIEAEQRLYQGIEVWETMRAGLGNDDANRVSLFEIQSNTYRNLQEVLSDQSKINDALEISEKGRARAYSELLARRLADVSSQQANIEPPNIEQIKEIAKRQNATLVEYSITYDTFNIEGKRQVKESELLIWVVKPTGEVAFRRTDLKFLWQQQKMSLASLVYTTRDAIGLRGDPLTSAVPPEPIDIDDQEQQLKLLHKILIQPIADLLPNNPEDHVIFIPQESLFLVPFAALQDESGKYLIEQHTILTAPAIQVLSLTEKQRQRVSGSGALVVGNPTMPRIPGKNGEPGEQLESLPGAEKEAIEIATLLNTQAITGDRATKLSIMQQLPKARIIHLATHGLLDDFRDLGVPGAIALAPSGQDDGLLTSTDILNLKLTAELVVLSACNTGKGKITGDGVIGLSRALIAAGVPSVVVSLWSVPDAPTADLMTEFYKQLQQNPDKARALRLAMLATMKNNPDPKNWAAFTLIGEAE